MFVSYNSSSIHWHSWDVGHPGPRCPQAGCDQPADICKSRSCIALAPINTAQVQTREDAVALLQHIRIPLVRFYILKWIGSRDCMYIWRLVLNFSILFL